MIKNETLHFDYSELKALMEAKGYTCYSLSNELGVTASTMQNKMRGIGYGGWTSAEIYRLCRILNIKDGDIARYFLTPLKNTDGWR